VTVSLLMALPMGRQWSWLPIAVAKLLLEAETNRQRKSERL
jgi:hypothetical protein